MRFFAEIQRVDEEQRLVSGYAATEQRATDGLVVTRDALAGAVDGYMEWANLRAMHRDAVGVTREASVDDGGLYITAEVVDDDAWEKVKRGVYKGFSIGAKVTERDPSDKTMVRGIELREISLVDRPADPGAKIDLWHADGFTSDETEDEDGEDLERRSFTQDQRDKMAAKGEAMPDGSFPIANRQDLENAIRAYGRAKNKRAARRHIMKRARALGAMDLIPEDWKSMNRADQAEGQDKIERAEGDAEVAAEVAGDGAAAEAEAVAEGDPAPAAEADPVARAVESGRAAMAKVGEAVEAVERAAAPAEEPVDRAELPGAELRRGIYSVGRLGSLVAELAYMAMDAQFESEIEGDDSPVPGKLRSALIELAKAYKAMSDEELAELLNGVGVDVQLENGVIMLMAASGGLERAEGAGLTDDQGAKLTAVFEAFVARGWTAPQPAQEPAEVSDLRRNVESLTVDRDTLLRAHEELTGRMTELSDTVTRLSATVAPPKTAGALARAVDKAEDAAGNQVEAPAAPAQPTDKDIQRALEAMSDDDRANLLMRVSLARPLPVIR